jgi:hypothetical protein
MILIDGRPREDIFVLSCTGEIKSLILGSMDYGLGLCKLVNWFFLPREKLFLSKWLCLV